MNAQLESIFDELETQRAQLLNELRTLSTQTLNARSAKKWSANEIVAHLIAAERLSLQYLQKKVLAINEVSDTGIWEEMKMNFLKVSQRIPGLKFRAPKMVVERTAVYNTFAELEEDWNQLRREIRDFLETIPDQHIHRKIYRHAVAGRLNLRHALLFFREHIIHHHPQIKKRIK